MNKETVARQQITIADVRDGEKGAKGDTGPRGANGSNGAAAEFYRLQPRTEKAIVASDNVLRVNLEYTIEHVKGAHIRVETGDALGYHLIAWTNQGEFLTMTAGRVNSGTYQMANYSKAKDRPDFINVELRNKVNKTLDRRTVQITMEAASFVNVIGDVRETVSQHGRNISKIEQKADGISLKVERMKNGVRNLLKGCRLNVTSSQYGFGAEKIEDRWVKLKPDTDYTLTVCGRISGNAKANGQHLRVYLFNHSDTDSTKDWTWASVVQIGTEEDSVESIVVHTPSAGDGRRPTDDRYLVLCYPYPNQEQGKNGEVTVRWIVITEGTQAAASWIPAEGETGEEKAREVEARLENGEFRVISNSTVFVDNNGKETVLIEGGKLSAALIDAVKIVAAGIQAQDIDAGKATIRNLIVDGDSEFRGKLKGTSGSFTSLDCLDGTNKVGGIKFGTLGSKGYMTFTGDFGMWGETTGDIRKRFHNFYATNIYCNSQFGHKSRVCAFIRDEEMFIYNDGHIDSNGIRIMLTFGFKRINGRQTNYYKIPMCSPGLGGENGAIMDIDNPKAQKGTQTYYDEVPVGIPIDVVIFNCTRGCIYDFIGMGYGKQWTVINGNDRTSVTICCHGGSFDVHGGYVLDCHYVNPAWLSPSSVDATSPGAGIMVGREMDMNW